ncbi:MAG: hypothetical protein LC096_07005 [Bacteroidia bacterium]|nr:hypothetical protein [Bacteroidia bacterium]
MLHTNGSRYSRIKKKILSQTETPENNVVNEPLPNTNKTETKQPVNTESKKYVIPPPIAPQKKSSIDKLKEQILNNISADIKPKQDVQESINSNIEANNTPLQTDTFTKVWDTFLENLENANKKSLNIILKNSRWEILDENTVLLNLSSEHEKEMFDEERIHVVPFFRSNLSNNSIEIRVNVELTNTFQKAFTSKEKFIAMAQNNPNLIELQKILALEIE